MISEHIQVILVVTGAMTAGAGMGGFLFPRQVFRLFFGGGELEGALTLVARHWGWLGFLVGALLIWAGIDPRIRIAGIVVGALEKIVFAGLVFLGPLKKPGLAPWAAAGDSLMVLLYVGYLLGG